MTRALQCCSVSPSPWATKARRPATSSSAPPGWKAMPRSWMRKSPPQRSWLPPTNVIGTPRARRAWSFATVPKCRRGITEPYSNQKSNRSPLMRSASPRSGTASRKRSNAAATAAGTWPRWASATTTTREVGEGTTPKLVPFQRFTPAREDHVGTALGIVGRGRKRLSYLTFREPRRILAGRDQLDNPARQLFRDRPDGRGLPRQLLDLVRSRSHRADARDGADLQGARATGRLPRRFRRQHPLPGRCPLRRSRAGPLLGARARVPAGDLWVRGGPGGDGRAARHRRDLARLPHPPAHPHAPAGPCPRPAEADSGSGGSVTAHALDRHHPHSSSQV